MKKKIFFSLVVGLAFVGACSTESDPIADAPATISGADSATTNPDATTETTVGVPASDAPTGSEVQPRRLRVGAEVLADDGFALLADRRVGVVLNQASLVRGQSLLDVLATSDRLDLVAAFAPEHGVRGTAPAGAGVGDGIDQTTGVPVYSLYGDVRAPTAAMLADVDVLLFDLQDVGARPYTYISTMGLAMQAAADAGVPFVVLDRPNPLGGHYIDGFIRAEAEHSFIGQYPIPSAHGMTTGELALAIKGEGWLPGLEELDLQVVAMDGWQRTDRWTDTGLAWTPPSPSLPTVTSSEVYSGTVLFEAAAVSVGRGTAEPFSAIGAPWVDSDQLSLVLNGRGLPGVRFEPVTFTPLASEAVPSPPFEGEVLTGIRLVVVDGATYRPVETAVHLLTALNAQAVEQEIDGFIANPALLDLLAGTDRFRLAVEAGTDPADIARSWADEVSDFATLRAPYLLYR